ncbi:TPA: hypothetical protein SAY52_002015 [Burkholderia cenocepacia]|uniref:hypothetical protein n=1 Tax=unclassified Burkholderia TaxID=2613784 RepID=UPI00158BD9A9|nr:MULTISPECIES: hypothetical protein [unclassified Burkholderia]HEF5871418.1 hypothetical protein [Burkholderia cenocepacia]
MAPALLALAAMCAAAGGRDVTLVLPRAPRAGDTVFVEVDVGAIGAGQEIDVQTSSGERLGTISPYGVKSGRAAGTYTLPVPADAVCGRRLALRITITRASGGARAPEPREVPDIRAVLH